MVRVIVRFPDGLMESHEHEADSFYFGDGILWLVAGGPDHEQVVAYPQVWVLSVEKAKPCCQS